MLPADEAARLEPLVAELESRIRALKHAARNGRLKALSSSELSAWADYRDLGRLRKAKSAYITETGDMLVDPARDSRAVLLVFGGLKSMTGMELPKFDKALRRFGVSTVYLSDPRRLMLLDGLASFGGFEATVGGLARLVRALRGVRVYCLGFSA